MRITSSAICGTDLQMIRGTMLGMKPGTVLGHEGMGVVEEVGRGVRNLARGDRVVIPSTIGCGSCSYCRSGHCAQCDTANPNGSLAGTAFFGGPEPMGPFDGLQAEYVRVPYANVGLVKLPDGVPDDQGDPAVGHLLHGLLRRPHRRDRRRQRGGGLGLPGRWGSSP